MFVFNENSILAKDSDSILRHLLIAYIFLIKNLLFSKLNLAKLNLTIITYFSLPIHLFQKNSQNSQEKIFDVVHFINFEAEN